MAKKTNKIRKIKNFIKIYVASGLVFLFVVLVIFEKHNNNISENTSMNKWISLSEIQRVKVLQKIIPESDNMDLLIGCMNKISALTDSNDMIIQTAASLCYNGIKLNSVPNEQ